MTDEGKRLNKYISDAGICSRREADRLIEAGKVEIQRKSRKDEPANAVLPAHTGDRVFHGDTVFVNGRELPKKEPGRVYYAYHKPRGIVCTSDRSVKENIIDAVGLPVKVTYAGRLDKDSSGLIILTNDGAFSDGLMRASAYHEKEYVCTVDRPVTREFIEAMGSGVKILLDDEEHLRKNPKGVYVTTRPCEVRQTGERRFSIVLTQGFNRQIRRMCRALGYGVTSLVRTRIMNLTLAGLAEGRVRALTAEEVSSLGKGVRKSAARRDSGGNSGRGGQRENRPARDQAGNTKRSDPAHRETSRHSGTKSPARGSGGGKR